MSLPGVIVHALGVLVCCMPCRARSPDGGVCCKAAILPAHIACGGVAQLCEPLRLVDHHGGQGHDCRRCCKGCFGEAARRHPNPSKPVALSYDKLLAALRSSASRGTAPRRAGPGLRVMQRRRKAPASVPGSSPPRARRRPLRSWCALQAPRRPRVRCACATAASSTAHAPGCACYPEVTYHLPLSCYI